MSPRGSPRSWLHRAVPFLAVAAVLVVHAPLEARQSPLVGVVTDAATGGALDAAWVQLSANGEALGARLTDGRGRFQFEEVPDGRYRLSVSRIGYASLEAEVVHPLGDDPGVVLRMTSEPYQLAPIVVSANLTLETMLASPSAITVLPRSVVTRSFTPTTLDLLRDAPGVSFASKGLFDNTFMTRGPRPVTAEGVLVLSDYRYAAIPVLEFISTGLIPPTQEDVQRIEVVRGPGAVVYGPNSRRGVVHILTLSPLGPPETVVSVAGGERSFLDASARISRPLGERAGVKLSLRYAGGTEWPYEDPVEVLNREAALAAGARADTLRIGRRETRSDVYQADARFDWKVTDEATVVSSFGLSRGSGVSTGGDAGAAQGIGWLYAFGQVRLDHPRYFANVLYNWSDAGDTYNLRSGGTLVDNSRLFGAQFQRRAVLGPTRLLAGADFRLADPRSEGTLYGRFEDDDSLRETGLYLHTSTSVSPRVELVGALRLDHHNRLDEAFHLSPRAALVLRPAADHALRASWSQSFAQPTTRDLFPDLSVGPLGPLPYEIRISGSGGRGFTFERDCGGLCMRVPAAFAGGQLATLPADATLVWPTLVAILQAQGVDLSGLPAPNASQVGTVLATLSPATGGFVPVSPSSVTDVPAVRRSLESTFEVGYKGQPSPSLFAALDVYFTRATRVFSTGSTVNTPSVFLDPATLAQYLGQFLPPDAIPPLVAALASIPVGTVSPREVPGADLLIFSPTQQGGRYSYWGFEATGNWRASDRFTANLGYAWTSTDSTGLDGVPGVLMFHAPQHRGNLGLEFEDAGAGLNGYLRSRAISGFSVLTPAYVGEVSAYGVVDVGGGVRVRQAPEVWVRVDALNVLDYRHSQFVGSPELGRLATLRMSLRW
jgi:outer membrane receptor for ferrienterochelin and colicins